MAHSFTGRSHVSANEEAKNACRTHSYLTGNLHSTTASISFHDSVLNYAKHGDLVSLRKCLSENSSQVLAARDQVLTRSTLERELEEVANRSVEFSMCRLSHLLLSQYRRGLGLVSYGVLVWDTYNLYNSWWRYECNNATYKRQSTNMTNVAVFQHQADILQTEERQWTALHLAAANNRYATA